MATTKKAAPAKPAAKKTTSTALTVWEQEMAEAAVAQSKAEVITGGFKTIQTRGGVLKVDDNPVDGNELNVVVLASVHENQLYAGSFDPDSPASPICYAFGNDDDAMVPHPEAPSPQHETCNGCPNNEWGSADKGRGKACKNVRRLLVVTEDAVESDDDLKDAEARMLKLPVTSVKNWSNYMRGTLAEDLHLPSYGAVTNIRLAQDPKTQFKVMFKFESKVEFDEGLYNAMKKKVAEAEKTIANAYPVFEAEVKPVKVNRKIAPAKVAGKAPVKAKSKY